MTLRGGRLEAEGSSAGGVLRAAGAVPLHPARDVPAFLLRAAASSTLQAVALEARARGYSAPVLDYGHELSLHLESL
eukprot:CAMPEP_0182857246 /NCGR_PEP_ID=MMETSP0034_2-20130328/2935_1 /TAXON_ID=156128 /ORGANISM="Nephroselmis pyriformis, Strain CCMP717" /LENGTH=76 /DNA_ID=CAMNT_0024988457 /DNA_START=356 /DNA_END=582 /DNA_ORIENTATION=+